MGGNKAGVIGLILGVIAISVAFYKYSDTDSANASKTSKVKKSATAKKPLEAAAKP